MSELTKITEPLASSITESLELSDDATQALTENIAPADYLQQLIENELFNDAVTFLANALPKREAVWWACVCAKQKVNEDTPDTDIKAIELAEAWVYKPIQTVCDPTFPAAEATELKTAAGWAAIAAFWSGENISPSKEAVIPPTNDLTGKAVNGAIQLAATLNTEAKQINEQYLTFLTKGMDIANGGDGRDAK